MKKKIITFDIWDTLIKRKCHPEETKINTLDYYLTKYKESLKEEYQDLFALYLYRDKLETKGYNENEKKGLGREIKIEEIFKTLVETTIIDGKLKDFELKEIQSELLEVEVKREIEVTYVNPYIVDILKEYKDYTMYCISDFYMGAKELKRILESKNLDKYFKKIYSSADSYKTKRDGGEIFKLFVKEENISISDIIHVGDNKVADHEIPKKLGVLKTIEIPNPKEYDFNPSTYTKLDFKLDKIKKYETNSKDRLYNIGVDFSLFAYFFIYDIIKDAMKKGYNHIYYQTREGENFIKFHEIIRENNPFGYDIPTASLLEVSRVGTFAPSLKELSIAELLRMWSQYRGQSLKALFITLGVDIKPYLQYIKKYDLKPEEYINEPWFNVQLQNLFEDDEFKEKINKELANKKEELIKYFKKVGITNETEKIYIVDIGWRGTIQDNIAYIYDKTFVDGAYITLYDYFNYQKKNVRKHSYIEDNYIKYEIMSPMITVMEMLFNSTSGSVIGYENSKSIRKAKKEESDYAKNVVSNIQNGMLDGAKRINEQMKNRSVFRNDYLQNVYELLKNKKENPDKDLVITYFNLVHNDTFGTGEYIDPKKKLSKLQRFNLIKIRRELRVEPWKEAYMIINELNYIKPLLSLKKIINKIISIPRKVASFIKRGLKKVLKSKKVNNK